MRIHNKHSCWQEEEFHLGIVQVLAITVHCSPCEYCSGRPNLYEDLAVSRLWGLGLMLSREEICHSDIMRYHWLVLICAHHCDDGECHSKIVSCQWKMLFPVRLGGDHKKMKDKAGKWRCQNLTVLVNSPLPRTYLRSSARRCISLSS